MTSTQSITEALARTFHRLDQETKQFYGEDYLSRGRSCFIYLYWFQKVRTLEVYMVQCLVVLLDVARVFNPLSRQQPYK